MRESHSIVTREALTAGVPVICTDTLGPEEVVRYGDNGFVVPAATPRVAAAMARSLGTTPARPAPRGARRGPVRTIEDQVDRPQRLFGELVAQAVPTAPPPSAAFGASCFSSGSTAHRCGTGRSCRPKRSGCSACIVT